MPKTTQLMKVNANGKKYTIVFRNGDKEPYVVYCYKLVTDRYGYLTEKKSIVAKSACFKGAINYVASEY